MTLLLLVLLRVLLRALVLGAGQRTCSEQTPAAAGQTAREGWAALP